MISFRHNRALGLFACVVSLSGNVPAEAQLIGQEFQVNTYTRSHQQYAAVAANDQGGFLVVWDSFGQDGSSNGVFGRLYDASGAPSPTDFQVNTYTTGPQRFPLTTALSSGEFVVTWSSPQEDGWNWGVFARCFSADGSPVGAEFHVNTHTLDGQYPSGIASDDSGSFVIVWSSLNQDGDDMGIFGQRFDPSCAPVGSEFQVNSLTAGSQSSAAVAKSSAGGFVVVWEDRVPVAGGPRVVGRRFDSSGLPLGAESQIAVATTGWQSAPSIAFDDSGDFVVVWERHEMFTGLSDIDARIFDLNGEARGEPFSVNAFTTSDQVSPAVSREESGGFLVTWTSWEQDGFRGGVFAQRLGPSSNRLGSELQVSTFASASQANPSLANAGSAGFVVVWDSRYQDGSSYGVFGQRLPALCFTDGFESEDACTWSTAVGGGCP